jgi:hypothetical protein
MNNNKIRNIAEDILAKLRFIKLHHVCSLEVGNESKIILNYIDTISLNDINIILPIQKSLTDTDCAICIENIKLNSDVRIMNCNHIFHTDCLDKWLIKNKTCPICRYHFANKQNLPTSCIIDN